MAKDDFFKSLGLFSVEGFLDAAYCQSVSKELSEKETQQSPLPEYKLGIEKERGVSTRPRVALDPIDDYIPEIESKLSNILPVIATYFQVELESCQTPYFGIYNKGDFMKKHIDVVGVSDTNQFGPQRKVTVIIYLNYLLE